jgi:tetratricopeptide (TPR) repeat protein
VVRLGEEGRTCYVRGDLAGALDRYGRACELVRETIGRSDGEAEDVRQLGSMLYTLGEWQLEAGEHTPSVETLTEAEAVYERLGERAAQLVADVVIRRARVHAAAGQPLSAIADAQQATLACLELLAGPAGRSGAVEAARVVAFSGRVQLAVRGDPDLAVGAADWALREYLRAFRSGDRLSVPVEHAPAMNAAGRVAYIVHTAADRSELAETARWFAEDGKGPPQVDELVEEVRAAPTLAGVLASLGRADLVATLTSPATDVRILVPAMRCSPQVAPGYAQTLGELQLRADGLDQVLLGLEAHALFAAASQRRVPSMRYEFGHFGPRWAAAVVNVGQRHAEAGNLAAALDAARWLGGIVGQLAPHTMIDAEARRTALDTARWQRAILTDAGDHTAAAAVSQVIATLEALGSI